MAEVKKMYLVVVYYGLYDDYTEEVEKAFHTKAEAEKFIKDHPVKNMKYKISEVEVG